MDETFDFVVIGSGGGGLVAALVMRALGKSVLVVEKTALVGGTTAMSGGVMWIPNNRFMKEQGVEESPQRALDYMNATIGLSPDVPGASAERQRAYVDQAPKMLDFLIGRGLKFRRLPLWPDYYSEAPGASQPGRTVVAELFDGKRLGAWREKLRPGFLPLPARLDEAVFLPNFKRTWAAKKVLGKVLLRAIAGKITGKQWLAAGNALQGSMLDAALRAGADIRVETPVRQLIVEGGRVVGVVVEQVGRERRIGALLGVLIAAGGFARNQRMLNRHIPGQSAEWTNTSEGDTGDLIEEAERLGATIAQMDVQVSNQLALAPGGKPGAIKPAVQSDMAKPHSIVVDQSGQRFHSEAGSYMDFCRAMVERNKTVGAVPSWMIMDSQFIDTYMLAGSMPGAKKPAAWFEEGFLKKADSIDGLALECGIEPAVLTATVERFNGFARAGEDQDFRRGSRFHHLWLGDNLHKSHATLGALEKGPFYALQIYPGNVSTFGGLVTDAHAAVLKADGSPIPGLYATGTSTASVMGRTSPGAGSSIGPSMTWGYVAAKHAANADNMELAGA